MRRRVRLVLILGLLVVVVGGVGALVLTTKPDLDDGRARVDAAWTPMRKPLQLRYQVLAGVDVKMTEAGNGDRPVLEVLRAALDRWADLAGDSDAAADAGTETETANELEALAARVRASINGSERLKNNKGVTDAMALFDVTVVPPPLVRTYNRAAQRYQETREGTLESVVAAVLGFESRPRFVVGG
jgi:hypothetical protein